VAAWQREDYDLILMDVQMPGVDGFEATHRIREQEKATGRHIPIVAMTAHALEGDRERCIAAGMDAYVPKPVAQSEFFRAIDQCLAGLSPVAYRERIAPANLELALRALGDDVPILNKLCAYFFREHAAQVSALEQALAAREAVAVERAAHRIKSAVGHFRAKRAWDLSQALERMGREGQLEGAPELLSTLRGEVGRLIAFLSERFPDAAPVGKETRANDGAN